MNYRPKEMDNLDCPMRLLIPIYSKVSGVLKKTYSEGGPLFFANFKSFGGTETKSNGVYSIIDTAMITTWYHPDIKSDCRVVRLEDGAVYEIINEPEDVNFRHQFLICKLKRVKGKA